jgi:hypothetical protein
VTGTPLRRFTAKTSASVVAILLTLSWASTAVTLALGGHLVSSVLLAVQAFATVVAILLTAHMLVRARRRSAWAELQAVPATATDALDRDT